MAVDAAHFPWPTFWSALLALARIGGIFVFLPLPGSQGIAEMARVMCVVALTAMLYPFWPVITTPPAGPFELAGWIGAEAMLGLTAGLIVALLAEAFVFGAQVLSLQAGFSYASTIDPTNHTDTGILSLLLNLLAGMLFFSLGADRLLVGAVARSFSTIPIGAFRAHPGTAQDILHLFSTSLATGFRCAVPLIGVLVLVDLALALAARINAQLQLLAMAFPVKMGIAFLVLAASLGAMPTLYQKLAATVGETLLHLTAVPVH